ncbi:hypothetical protein CFC21_039138, partial [Triticum aestivum]
ELTGDFWEELLSEG